jgi:hypothetical protein
MREFVIRQPPSRHLPEAASPSGARAVAAETPVPPASAHPHPLQTTCADLTSIDRFRAHTDHTVREPAPDCETWRPHQTCNTVQVSQRVGRSQVRVSGPRLALWHDARASAPAPASLHQPRLAPALSRSVSAPDCRLMRIRHPRAYRAHVATMASTASAITAVASQPRTIRRRSITNRPIIRSHRHDRHGNDAVDDGAPEKCFDGIDGREVERHAQQSRDGHDHVEASRFQELAP